MTNCPEGYYPEVYYVKARKSLGGVYEEALILGTNNLKQFIKDWQQSFINSSSEILGDLEISTENCKILHCDNPLPERVFVVYWNRGNESDWCVCRTEDEIRELINNVCSGKLDYSSIEFFIHKDIKVIEVNPSLRQK